ncbi:hypothetical protein [Natronorubrum bangense]|uniref:Glutamate--cysteine ligase n=2 Tax=Natronorubrum bangense TaxID=61858 RepID=L9WKN2_9EURY|nr:hypothetical protein [Natronorubrum bangense]ELY49786.1 hypothetical protein C494_07235 [Natronorubrum bangense JCM 10635]QCC55412.1 hypothetical protein DV706_13620 [Natronorubrum bangense]
MADRIDLVRRSLEDTTQREFNRRVDEQATRLTDAVRAGRLDNPSFGLGIELEAYAVDDTGRLTRVPDAVLEGPCEKELGRHNVEFNTSPNRFDGDEATVQAAQLRRRYRRVQQAAEQADTEIVLDAMWTIPPREGTQAYLSDVRERDGVTIAENMTPSARYWAIDNDVLGQTEGAITLSVPGAEREFPSILFESLASSIQPHVQVPDVEAFPRYYNTAIRTLGPVLAVATNAPLLPPDLYDIEDPYRVLEETDHELRIPVFEQSINQAWEKVCFPAEIQRTAETIDTLVADPTCAPFLREWLADGDRETLTDRFWELNHKRGTYWRWLRAVIGGQPVGQGDHWSIRIEYRPLPTQPTIAENIGFQWLVAGLVRGLCAADHPLVSLEHDAAKRSFYSAVKNGLDADLVWVTADGDRTTDRAVLYEELFAFARRGLRMQGIATESIEEYLAPLEARWTARTTPSRWKLDRVREQLDAGMPFDDAVHEMQTEYIRQARTGEPITQWP